MVISDDQQCFHEKNLHWDSSTQIAAEKSVTFGIASPLTGRFKGSAIYCVIGFCSFLKKLANLRMLPSLLKEKFHTRNSSKKAV